MEKTNIELFNEVSLRILSSLYETFPEPSYVDPNVLGLLDERPPQNSIGQIVYSDEWRKLDSFIKSTATWLSDEGYLSHKPNHSMFSSRYTLSSVGLKCLRHVEQPEIGAVTLGEQIKDASSVAVRATASKLMDQFLAVGTLVLSKAAGLG